MRMAPIVLASCILLNGCGDALPNISSVQINNATVDVEIVSSAEAQMMGLSGRDFLAENTGMLFVHNKSDRHSIWMKDMLFDIDVIWIDENGEIVWMIEDMKPSSYPKTFIPEVDAKYVLEVNAGFVDKNGVDSGTKVKFVE